MKKSILILSIVLLAFNTSHSQVKKGDKMIGGSVGLMYHPDYFSASISPSYSVFLSDHFLLGGGVSLNGSWMDSNSDIDISIGPNIRYYFNPDSQFAYFAGLNGGIGYRFNTSSTTSILGGNAGVTYFLTDNVALEGVLSSNHIFQQEYNDWLGLQFRIGLQIVLQ